MTPRETQTHTMMRELTEQIPKVIRKGPLFFLNRNPHQLPETSPE